MSAGACGRRAARRCARLACALVLVAGCTLPGRGAQAAEPATGLVAEEIAAGAGWPAQANELLGAVYAGEQGWVRAHAWALWAGLTGPSRTIDGGRPLPVWETWYSATEVFDATSAPLSAGRTKRRQTELPRQAMHRQAAMGGEAAALMSFVKLNPAAATFVRDQRYHLRATLDALNRGLDARAAPVEERSIKPFPREAILLKVVLWLVKDAASPESEGGLTAFPLWDPADPPPGNGQTPTHLTWRRCVAVDPTGTRAPGAIARVTCNGVSNAEAPVVGLDRFYAFRLTTDEAVADARHFMTVLSGAGGEQERFVTNAGQTPRLGDHVALAAMHVTTKEIDDWTFQTFWWSPDPEAAPFGHDRPEGIGTPWSSYAMCAAYSMVTPRQADGGPHVCFNPYLETDLGPTRAYEEGGVAQPPDPMAGTRSNCMNCHHHAAWRAEPPANPQGTGLVRPDDPSFSGVMKTDFLWSLVFHAQPPAGP